ncbi:TPA: tetratricopeptide repeat protein [Burkholderia cenocepacia]|nr:tetratricopeptide repeat protein [Burkholderia cenocepacia]HDR9813447.1 tetratricopeptide repeat protein [Burkholderia cenocepacia]HDR9820022.1 tetratricopeptide repeat protein [Burkholderia cenocepacia]HDR9830517.1 tetratricopeptide repeat protein [Burkholderia cenocepacia]
MKCLALRACAFAAVLPLFAGGCAPGIQTRPALSHKSDDPQAELRIADSALAGGNVDLASTLYGKVLARHPDSLAAQLGLADVNYRAGDLERARMLYEQARQQAPAELGPQVGLARVALRQRRLDEAAHRYRDLLAAQPNLPLAAQGLGTVLDLQGRHEDAQAVYRDALRAHPDAQGLRVDLGLSLVLSNRPREGVNVLLDVAGLPDAPWQARQNLAFAYGVLGNTDSAKKLLSADLPASAVADNLRVYQAVRAQLASRPVADAARPLKGVALEPRTVPPVTGAAK